MERGDHDKRAEIKLREVQELRGSRVELSMLEWLWEGGNGRLEGASVEVKGTDMLW